MVGSDVFSTEIVPFFRGHSLVFGGYFLADASPPWKVNSSTKRSTTSKVSNLRNFRSTNVFKCLGEMQGFWVPQSAYRGEGGYDSIHNTKLHLTIWGVGNLE